MDSMYEESNAFFSADQKLYEEYCSNGQFQLAVKIVEQEKYKNL